MSEQPIVTWSEEDGEYVAIMPGRPWVSGLGATPAEAIAELQAALRLIAEVRG